MSQFWLFESFKSLNGKYIILLFSFVQRSRYPVKHIRSVQHFKQLQVPSFTESVELFRF